MKEYTLETKARYATVTNSVNPITGNDIVLVGVFSKISGRLLATYDVSEHTPFESFSALLKFAKASQLDTPSHPSHDLPSDDLLGGVSPSSSVELHPSNDALTDDPHSPVQSPIINSDVAFENGSLAGESSPVAASSYPATSDTLFSYRDLNTIVNALDHYIDFISKSDLKELEHLNIDFESDRKASISRLLSFTHRIAGIASSMDGGQL